MNANRTTSAHNIADSWGCDGFIKARNSHITGDATLRIGLASILSNTENCLFRQKRGSAFWLNGRTNLHNKIIGFNGTYLDINGPICKDIFSRLPVFVRIFYAKIRMALTLPGLLRGGQSNIQTGGKGKITITYNFLKWTHMRSNWKEKDFIMSVQYCDLMKYQQKPDWLLVQFLWKIKSI